MPKRRLVPKNFGQIFVEDMRRILKPGAPRSIGKPNLYRKINSWGRTINEIQQFLLEWNAYLQWKIIKIDKKED